jgi:GH25 family lysozyme M1 (1,4-beta-N-acetylmuramidase)
VTILFVDVSHHDWRRRVEAHHPGQLDWAKVRAATSAAMCARASYGDPAGFSPGTDHFADFHAGARTAGFTLRGGYHNLVRGDNANMARQVEAFRRELGRQDCDWAMVDIERYEELVERDLWPRFVDVLRFRDQWAKVEDRPLAYYLPKWLWRDFYGSPDLAQLGGPLVASDFGDNSTGSPSALYTAQHGDDGRGWRAYGGVTPAVWQYGSRCDVPGASDRTDINAFRGSLDELAALLTGGDMALSDDDIRRIWGWPTNPDTQLTPAQRQAWVTLFGGTTAAREAASTAKIIAANVARLVGADWVDEEAIVSGVLAGLAKLPAETIAEHLAATLPAEVAAGVAKSLGERSGGQA